jgi:hypothetical protein
MTIASYFNILRSKELEIERLECEIDDLSRHYVIAEAAITYVHALQAAHHGPYKKQLEKARRALVKEVEDFWEEEN